MECDFCPKTNRCPEFMSTETFSKILDQIKPHTDYIYLHVKGEPLLHPELDKILDLSHEKGFHVNITTNGTLISMVKDILLSKPAIRQINISLHSIEGNHMLDKTSSYMEDILAFTKEAISKTDMIVSLRLWNLGKEDIKDNMSRKNDSILKSIENSFNLPYRIEEKSGLERGIKLAERVYINQDFQFSWPNLDEKETNTTGFCYALRDQAAILVDGAVVPCCLDNDGVMKLGNIHYGSFSEIIESERANNIVNGFSKRHVAEELCKKCGYIKKFT